VRTFGSVGIVQKASVSLTIVSYMGVIIGYVNKMLLFPHLLTTSEVGLANTLVSTAAIFAQFSALGMTGVTLRFFPFFKDEKRSHHGFLFWVTVIVTSGALLVSVLFLLFESKFSLLFGKNAPILVEYYYYLIPLGLASLFFQVYDSYLRSLLKTVVPSFLNEVYLRLAVTLTITAYALNWVDFKGFVNLYVGANCSIAVLVILYAMTIGQFRILPKLTFRVKRLSKGIIRFGFFSILSSTGNVLIASIDALMVAALVTNGMHFNGIYTTVFFMTTLMLIPYRSVLKISGPLVAQHWKSGDMNAMGKLYKQVTSVNTALGVFIFAGLWLCLDNIFAFMPDVYAEGKYVFLFISIGRLFDMITGLNGIITITSRKYVYDLFFTLFLILLTVGSNYFFIKIIGMEMNGAAVATMITLVAYNILRLLFVWFMFRIHPFTSRIFGILLVGLGIVGLVTFIPPLSWPVADIFVRGIIVTLLYWPLLIYARQVPEISQALNKYLSKTRLKFRVPE